MHHINIIYPHTFWRGPVPNLQVGPVKSFQILTTFEIIYIISAPSNFTYYAHTLYISIVIVFESWDNPMLVIGKRDTTYKHEVMHWDKFWGIAQISCFYGCFS